MVNENVTIDGQITCSGTVNLILKDDVTLHAKKGITVADSNDLNIYAGNSTATVAGTGALMIDNVDDNCAGIGGDAVNKDSGVIMIAGSVITVTGGEHGAGIGGGNGGAGGAEHREMKICGGTVYVYGGTGAAGFGAGLNGTVYFDLYGGNVTFIGGTGASGCGLSAAGVTGWAEKVLHSDTYGGNPSAYRLLYKTEIDSPWYKASFGLGDTTKRSEIAFRIWGTENHTHNFVKHDKVDATPTTHGHKEYYQCECGDTYSDAALQNEISYPLNWWVSTYNSYAESAIIHYFTFSLVGDDEIQPSACSCDGCYKSPLPLTVNVSETDGTVTFDDFYASTWTYAGIEIPSEANGGIRYYQGSTLLAGKPTAAGTYTVEVSDVGQTCTVTKSFTIAANNNNSGNSPAPVQPQPVVSDIAKEAEAEIKGSEVKATDKVGVELTKNKASDFVDKTEDGEMAVRIELNRFTVELDKTALDTVAKSTKKGEDIITIKADEFPASGMNLAQMATLNSIKPEFIFEAYVERNNERVHDFEGGTAVVFANAKDAAITYVIGDETVVKEEKGKLVALKKGSTAVDIIVKEDGTEKIYRLIVRVPE